MPPKLRTTVVRFGTPQWSTRARRHAGRRGKARARYGFEKRKHKKNFVISYLFGFATSLFQFDSLLHVDIIFVRRRGGGGDTYGKRKGATAAAVGDVRAANEVFEKRVCVCVHATRPGRETRRLRFICIMLNGGTSTGWRAVGKQRRRRAERQ